MRETHRYIIHKPSLSKRSCPITACHKATGSSYEYLFNNIQLFQLMTTLPLDRKSANALIWEGILLVEVLTLDVSSMLLGHCGYLWGGAMGLLI